MKQNDIKVSFQSIKIPSTRKSFEIHETISISDLSIFLFYLFLRVSPIGKFRIVKICRCLILNIDNRSRTNSYKVQNGLKFWNFYLILNILSVLQMSNFSTPRCFNLFFFEFANCFMFLAFCCFNRYNFVMFTLANRWTSL